MDKKKIINIIEYTLVIITGIVYVLQCSSWTSPLYPYAYGYDSSWYAMMGRAITCGKVPYRDYFDLKGPMLFFYEAFGQLFLRDRNGIFLIQCISITITVVLIWKIAKLFTGRLGAAIVLFLYYYFAYALMWGGNTVEELFMPCSMAAVFLTLDFIIRGEGAVVSARHSALIMGIGFGIYFFSKMTVAAVICASVLTVIIILIKRREYDLILKCALYFLGGVLIVAVPLFIYFIVNGALKDFIYCVFVFAFRRSTDYYESFSLKWELNLLLCYAGFFYGLCMKHETKEDDQRRMYLIITAVTQYLLLHFGTPYLYYFLCQMPVLVITAVYFIKDMTDNINELREKGILNVKPGLRGIAICFIMLLVFDSYYTLTSDKFRENLMIYEEETGKNQYFACKEISALVPEWERSGIYNLESGMIYYEINQELPSNKYPVNLPYFLHLDPGIKSDVMSKLTLHTPKWIISERMWEFDDEDVKDFVFSHYELIADNDGEELYRVID